MNALTEALPKAAIAVADNEYPRVLASFLAENSRPFRPFSACAIPLPLK